jgi:glutathione-independent formaldehyde dehydrogenase
MRSLQGGQRSICACRTPISSDELARKGRMAFDFGEFWTKGLRMGTGQTNVKSYNRRLCRIIETHKAQPELIVSHQLSLDEAPEAYKHFDARENGWTKVVLRPEGKTSAHATGKPRAEHKRDHRHASRARH